jgi:hypothetical protein
MDTKGHANLALKLAALLHERNKGPSDPNDPNSVNAHQSKLKDLEEEALLAKLSNSN